MRRLGRVLLRLSLFAGSLVFVLKAFADYSEGNTQYSVTSESISFNDLPTLAICLEKKCNCKGSYHYGRDFTIDITLFDQLVERKTITLKQNQYVHTLNGLKFYLSSVKQTMRKEAEHRKKYQWKQCYKIIPRRDRNHKIDFENISIFLEITNLKGGLENNFFVKGLLTSEENSNGIVGEKWFDGNVETFWGK